MATLVFSERQQQLAVRLHLFSGRHSRRRRRRRRRDRDGDYPFATAAAAIKWAEGREYKEMCKIVREGENSWQSRTSVWQQCRLLKVTREKVSAGCTCWRSIKRSECENLYFWNEKNNYSSLNSIKFTFDVRRVRKSSNYDSLKYLAG